MRYPMAFQSPSGRCRAKATVSVAAGRASGTEVPSLNSNGTRISYRRNELIRGGTTHRELDSLLGQETQGLSWHRCFT